jgi:hypothetical protein
MLFVAGLQVVCIAIIYIDNTKTFKPYQYIVGIGDDYKVGRKNKQLIKRNQVQIYIPTTFFPKWERFQDTIEKDAQLKALQPPQYKGTLVSFALRLLINRYLKEQDMQSGYVDSAKKKKSAKDVGDAEGMGIVGEDGQVVEAQQEEAGDISLPIS